MKIREWIEYGCSEAGYPGLAERIKFEWNNRFTRRLGDANYFKNNSCYPGQGPHGWGRIRLSTKLWPTMDEKEQIDTVLHEVAHVIDIYQNGRTKEKGGHGITWKRIANKIGARPQRYCPQHVANFAKFRRRVTRYSVPCGCNTPHLITKHRYTKMAKMATVYRCKKCGQTLNVWKAQKVTA